MKNSILIACLVLGLCSNVFAALPLTKSIRTGTDVSTSGGLTVTVNATAVNGKRVVVYNLIGRSDLSTSVIQVQRADATGTTNNYTTKLSFDVGAATAHFNAAGSPIVLGDPGYAYRFLLNSTTANGLLVNYGYE